MVRQWNDTAVAFDDEATLWDLLRGSQARRRSRCASDDRRMGRGALKRRGVGSIEAAGLEEGLSERGVGRGHA